MSFSELLLLFTLTNIFIIFYESFSGIGANANAVPTNCVQKCNQTLKNRQQCYERCEEMAHNNGLQNISEAGLGTGYKLYGYPYSANTRRVLAVLHEKKLSYEPVTVDLRSGEQKKPPFLAFNPFGLVPVFLDGHLKLTESRAISEYIANIHMSRGTKLVNYKNHKKMGTIIMWMTVESFEFDPPASLLTLEQCIKPMFGLKTDYKLVNATEPILEKVLDIYEMRLKKSKYLAGKTFTMADLYHLPNLEYLMTTPTSRLFKNRPSVNRWLTEIMARPAWKKACDAKLWWGDKKKKNV